jgi:uncharacterized protein (DUF924 family)
MNPSPTEGPEAVLEYWFGTAIDANAIAASQAKLWWGKDGATDREIRERFLPLRRAAIDGRLAAWTDRARLLLPAAGALGVDRRPGAVRGTVHRAAR